MAKTFVTEEELKAMPHGCANCGWAALPLRAFGKISKTKSGKCEWPVPPVPYMLDNCVAVTVRGASIWWNTGAGCPAWRVCDVDQCKGCSSPIDKEQVDDWGGWCDDCIAKGRNFDKGQK
jgi:hypothetical protein